MPLRTVTQARSRTVILGYLAAAAAGVQRLDRTSVTQWLDRHGLKIGDRGLRDALSLRLSRQGAGPASDVDPNECGWISESLDVDATKMDLDLAVVVFPASDRTARIIDVLRSTDRAVRIYRGYESELAVVLAYDGARERQRLQTILEEQEPELHWIVVREVDNGPAEATWLSLAQRAAETEGFLSQ